MSESDDLRRVTEKLKQQATQKADEAIKVADQKIREAQ